MDPDMALHKLKEGNKRFTEKMLKPKSEVCDRSGLIVGQQPYAAVITCSDSRVAPEIIFDTGFNEIFVIRNAGNVAAGIEIASVEYALCHLNVPLVLVLGHEKCGAVKAACCVFEDGECEGHFSHIYEKIRPSVEKYKNDDDRVTLVEYANTRHTKQCLLDSDIVKKLVESGSVAIHCARYQIESGVVEFFE
ncbi:MAG: carbonic anhydrase [Clostridiales bacterium]|jgi:carbonic anhydrase|nr:carbonic anhydrase [Clostridiales bacterium]